MRKVLVLALVLVAMAMNTALAAHWVPLVEGTERVPGVMFDADSMQKTFDNIYFWERVQRNDEDYELRFARLGLKDYEFSDAVMAEKAQGQSMVYLHPQVWEEHGASAHPLRLAWMDRVLIRANDAVLIRSDIEIGNVEVPGEF